MVGNGGAGPGGHTQRLLTVVKSGSIQDVKAMPQDKVHVWPHLLAVEFVAALAFERAWRDGDAEVVGQERVLFGGAEVTEVPGDLGAADEAGEISDGETRAIGRPRGLARIVELIGDAPRGSHPWRATGVPRVPLHAVWRDCSNLRSETLIPARVSQNPSRAYRSVR